MADDAVPDPARAAGHRPAAAAAMVLGFCALTGEMRAPAPVLPFALSLGLVAVSAAGLATLLATTGGRALVAGRTLRTAALVPVALVTFLVAGPRFRLVVLMLWILAVLLCVAVAIAAVFLVEPRRRDRVTALVAVIGVTIGGWYAEGAVREARLAVHADRYRAEAEAFIDRAGDGTTVFPGQDLDEPFLAGRHVPGTGGALDPVDVAWLWDPGEDGPASSWGVLYSPEGAPTVLGSAGAYVRGCTMAVVDDFYWCDFT